jgi:hypothetical protein
MPLPSRFTASELRNELAPLSGAFALRDIRRGTREHYPVLRDLADKHLLAVVDARGARVHSKRPLEFLVDSLAKGDCAFDTLRTAQGQPPHPSARLNDESFDRLCWLYGARLALEAGLAPWLEPHKKYRLLCWPDFGEIGNDPMGVMLCNILSSHYLDLPSLLEAARLPHATVYSLLNSLSLCGVLVPHPAGPAPSADAPRATIGTRRQHGVFARLFRRMRTPAGNGTP